MKKYRVCVYAICKNEEKFVDSWMDSMGEADLVVVTDTGSEDDTVQKLRDRGAVVYVDVVKPWRFDVARNISLEHIPQEIDICVCTDLDERFEPGWRGKLEQAWSSHQPVNSGPIRKKGKYIYNWSLKADGSPDVQFQYFKVHERKGFRWRCPVHEYVEYVDVLPVETVFIEGMVLNHYPDPAKSRGSYLPLLEMAVEEAPTDERMRYYLGREYRFKAQWQNCITTLTGFLEMPNAHWGEERCAAMRWIADSFAQLKQTQQAYCWYYKAIAEAPHMRDPYVEFAQLCYRQKNWPMVLFLVEEALKIKERSATYINMGYAWDFTLDDLGAIAAYWLHLPEKSLEHAQKALQLAPENERLKKNLAMIEQMPKK